VDVFDPLRGVLLGSAERAIWFASARQRRQSVGRGDPRKDRDPSAGGGKRLAAAAAASAGRVYPAAPGRPPSTRCWQTAAAAPTSASAGKVPLCVRSRLPTNRDVLNGTVGVAAVGGGGGGRRRGGSGPAAGDGRVRGRGGNVRRGGGAGLGGDDKQPSSAGKSGEHVQALQRAGGARGWGGGGVGGR